MRYSYVLVFPDAPPFESADMECRWRSFLGQFVKPIADKFPDLLFWCSYYNAAAKFRVVSSVPEEHEFILETAKACKLHLLAKSKDAEEDVTLVGDLGAPRFVDQSLGKDEKEKGEIRGRRALLTLKFLCATVRLHLDSLIPRGDGHWDYQPTPEPNLNPLGNNFESLVHLLGNVTRFEFDVHTMIGTIYEHPRRVSTTRHRLWR